MPLCHSSGAPITPIDKRQPDSAFKSVHELEDMVFRNTVPLLRGRPSLEDMLDSGLFVMDNTDKGDMLVNKNDSEGSVAAQPQQKNSLSGAKMKTVYHDTTIEMHRFPTSLLHWDDMVVTNLGNTKKAKLFEDNQPQQQVQSSNDNRQQQNQKKQLLRRQDVHKIGNHGEENVVSNLLVDGPYSASSSRQEGSRQGTEQTNNKMPVLSDASDSTSALRQKQNSTLYFEVSVDPMTKEQNATETIIVLPEGPMLRGERNSMYFGTLVNERYESHGADTPYITGAPEPGLSTSSSFPVVASLLMLLAVVVIWSKARRPKSDPHE